MKANERNIHADANYSICLAATSIFDEHRVIASDIQTTIAPAAGPSHGKIARRHTVSSVITSGTARPFRVTCSPEMEEAAILDVLQDAYGPETIDKRAIRLLETAMTFNPVIAIGQGAAIADVK